MCGFNNQLNHEVLNSLPKDKILDWSKLKEFADDKINVTENLKLLFSPFPSMFFLPFPKYISNSANAFNSNKSRILLFGNGLNLFAHGNGSYIQCSRNPLFRLVVL